MSKQIHNEQQRKKQVKVRLKESLVDEFDEWCEDNDTNRSEAIRSIMRARVSAESRDYRTPLEPPLDDDQLSDGYVVLCEIANTDGIIREDLAHTVISSKLGIPKQESRPVVLKPLIGKGYIKREANQYGMAAYRIRHYKKQ